MAKDGVPTLLNFANKLCRAISKFRTLIYMYYGSNPALIVAYESAAAACATLVAELAQVRKYGD